ncbi:hypothetical protein [Nocardia sp. NPDC047038]|uniref:hypothetical protein n=1 Tax=Nocardia sp. NPDC047038 TaxID=3154338 RepID=UPI0033F4A650
MTALLPLACGYLREDLINDRDRAAGEDVLRAAAWSRWNSKSRNRRCGCAASSKTPLPRGYSPVAWIET